MGNALYRKYRSKTLDEIVGQDHVTTTLKNALAQRKISHAYLLTGPRGVGKTSVARIIAREANGFSYDEHETHLDIIEIDAASNRRIDEVRDLREKVHSAPSVGKYKVYIIDEVHMLTKEAFNALLKTLEEPPDHVIFILATTELHKLPDTIVSRTQRYAFQSIDVNTMIGHIAHVAEQEGIAISEAAVMLIAEYAEGSFRDSLSLLDQVQHMVSSDKTVTEDIVAELLGAPSTKTVEHIIAGVEAGNVLSLQETFADINKRGFDSGKLIKSILKHLRSNIIQATRPLEKIALMKKLTEIQSSTQPAMLLELILYEAAFESRQLDNDSKMMPQLGTPKSAQKVTKTLKPKEEKKVQPSSTKPSSNKDTPKLIQGNSKKAVDKDEALSIEIDSDELWVQVLEKLKGAHNTLYGMARVVQPGTASADTITLHCKFPFHAKRLSDATHKRILEDTIKSIYGMPLSVMCVVKEQKGSSGDRGKTHPPKQAVQKSEDNALEAVSNIFGGAEVIESEV